MKQPTAPASPNHVAVRRSWYMSAATADALATAVDDLHFTTRRPKHEVLAALIDAALASRDQVADRLTRSAS
ncbi:hypothetical protein [Microbispora triticiradicis]|uniref:Uncharacterized protein n=2 Tax=Microbispora TaxID=2005 RepID=A0ABY3LQ13_9ACTN|nr:MULTISPECIES: hypothetical protein [Microbispora]TLP66533.1 hypothetical protein FED44_03470 [Microbispora fusca]TYB47426.1 hypothetical protein FXF59_29870 [Microbispora tritici]